MKSSKFLQDIKKKSIEELNIQKVVLLKEQFGLRMQKNSGSFKQNHFFKSIRKDIARINTILFNKKLEYHNDK